MHLNCYHLVTQYYSLMKKVFVRIMDRKNPYIVGMYVENNRSMENREQSLGMYHSVNVNVRIVAMEVFFNGFFYRNNNCIVVLF